MRNFYEKKSFLGEFIFRNKLQAVQILVGVFLWAGAGFGSAQAINATESDNRSGSDTMQLLFIHHSCGGQLLADQGPSSGDKCIFVSHPNGGGLRSELVKAGFSVNEASYGSAIGEDTDICHWAPKFRDQMDQILQTKNQDELLPEGKTNDVVAFKSCFPNNRFVGMGSEPGDPESCQLTVANAKSAYRSILPFFQQQPDVLFVAFTAPPLAKKSGFKSWIKSVFEGKPEHPALAREFNRWLADREGGWLADYPLSNVVVFDYYDILTKNGETNWSAYPTGGGGDSHPSSEGNAKAAEAFVPFIQKALATHRGN